MWQRYQLQVILLLLFLPTIQFAQSRLKIYVDCNQQWLCDMDFLRKEMGSVDFVRDRFLCDVQIISNVQFNGNGESNTLCFISQSLVSQRNDTLKYFNDVTATDDIKRKRMLKHLQIGLLPYLLEKGHEDYIELNIKHDEASKDTTAKKDPWNLWQFSISASGFSMVTKITAMPTSATASLHQGKPVKVNLVLKFTIPSTGDVSIFTIQIKTPPR